jgi:hypothetical protein
MAGSQEPVILLVQTQFDAPVKGSHSFHFILVLSL